MDQLKALWRKSQQPRTPSTASSAPPGSSSTPQVSGEHTPPAGLANRRTSSPATPATTSLRRHLGIRSKRPLEPASSSSAATPMPPASSEWVDAAHADKVLSRQNWTQISRLRADLLEELSAETGVPLAQMKQFIATLATEENKDPDRKEDASFDFHSMRVAGRPVALKVQVEDGKIVDIARPSKLNGLAVGFDRVMSSALPGVKTVDLGKILPPTHFVDVPLLPVQGRVAWVNWALLEEAMALDDKMKPEWRDEVLDCCRRRTLTPQLEKELMNQYALVVDVPPQASRGAPGQPSSKARASTSGPKPAGLIGKADRYLHTRYKGSGRAFMPMFRGGAFVKGGRRTPLAPDRHGSHSTGLMRPEEAMLEAAVGEAMSHLLGNRTTRVLLLIVPEIEENAKEVKACMAVRVGNHLRPAHFATPPVASRRMGVNEKLRDEALGRMYGDIGEEERNQLILEAQVSLAAKLNEFRVLHGSVDPTNFGLPGAALDFGTAGTQKHTGPKFMQAARQMLSDGRRLFGGEQKAQASSLKDTFGWSLDTWKKAYRRAKNIETLCGCGLPREVVERWVDEPGTDVHQLAKAIRRMGRWFHDDVRADATLPEQRSSLLDRHRLQSSLPGLFFDEQGALKAPTKDELLASADPYFTPDPASLTDEEHWRKKSDMRKYGFPQDRDDPQHKDVMASIDQSLGTIAELYPKLMQRAQREGVAAGTWEDEASFAKALRARARFQNRPIDALYSAEVRKNIAELAARHQASKRGIKDQQFLGEMAGLVDTIADSSKRVVDELLFKGGIQGGKTVEGRSCHRLQCRVIDGTAHYVEAEKDGSRRVCVEVPLSRLSSAQRAQLEALAPGEKLRLECPPDGDGDQPVAHALRVDRSAMLREPALLLQFDAEAYEYKTLTAQPQLAGASVDLGSAAQRYTYAVPNALELRLAASGLSRRDALSLPPERDPPGQDDDGAVAAASDA